MPRNYMHADARCRQIERLVRDSPGERIGGIAARAGLDYKTAAAYLRRLAREGRICVEYEMPAAPRGSTQRFYPPAAILAQARAA